MSNVLHLLRKAPKRTSAVIAVVAAVIAVPAMLLAWGPTRPTYTIEKPADHVTFNSITNNPNIGDERNFVGIKDAADKTASAWKDDVKVEQGKEYLVRMYVHNNAAANLNKVAENVTAKFNVPTQTANRIQIDGYLSSTNASPKEVWDQAVFTSDKRFKLNYVAGSASYTNNVFTSGTKLSDSVVSTGAKLGYDKLDGKIPGCFKYDGLVIFKVKPQVEDFKVEKTVRVSGAADKTFKEQVSVKPGDKVDYQVYFKNTGDTQLKDVVLKDTLPKAVKHVTGTTYLHNSDGTKQVSDAITSNGSNIGGYLPNGDAYMKFTAQIGNKDELECGTSTLKNVVKATTSTGSKEDSANVIVTNEDCEPEVKKIKVCELATKKTIMIDEKDFDSSKHSKNPEDCKEETKEVEVCNPTTGEIITVDEKDADKYVPVDSDKCKEMKVCVIKDKSTKIIKKSDFDSELYTTDFSVCEKTPEVPETPETPTTPTELPQTGPADAVAKFAAVVSLTASAAYYVTSRRQG